VGGEGEALEIFFSFTGDLTCSRRHCFHRNIRVPLQKCMAHPPSPENQ